MSIHKGKLQRLGEEFALHLMCGYSNPNCANNIENWRNRLTKKHDIESMKRMLPHLNNRQAKAVVNYAKQYIQPLINHYIAQYYYGI